MVAFLVSSAKTSVLMRGILGYHVELAASGLISWAFLRKQVQGKRFMELLACSLSKLTNTQGVLNRTCERTRMGEGPQSIHNIESLTVA